MDAMREIRGFRAREADYIMSENSSKPVASVRTRPFFGPKLTLYPDHIEGPGGTQPLGNVTDVAVNPQHKSAFLVITGTGFAWTHRVEPVQVGKAYVFASAVKLAVEQFTAREGRPE